MPREFEFIDQAEFDRLVGDLRLCNTKLMYDELSWLATGDRAVVGLVIRDRHDGDFGWVTFIRSGGGYETDDVGHSLPSAAAALNAVRELLSRTIGLGAHAHAN